MQVLVHVLAIAFYAAGATYYVVATYRLLQREKQ